MKDIELVVSTIFSGERFSIVPNSRSRSIRYVHETVGYGLKDNDKFVTLHFLYFKEKGVFHVQYMLNNKTYINDNLSHLKMSSKDNENLLKGLRELAMLGVTAIDIELYKKYKKVNWKVFAVELMR